MKLHVIFICSLFPLIFAGGCTWKNFRFFNSELQAKKIFLQSTIVCPDEDCPPFVGGLYSLSSPKPDKTKSTYPGIYRIKSCSVSLIAPDQILTNAHCIPKDIARVGSHCRDTLRIVFPKTNKYPLETFECQKVLNISPRSGKPGNPDWAILKLKRASARPPLILNHNGIQSMEPVTLYKINFGYNHSSPTLGTVVKTSCLANTGHRLSTHSIGPLSPLFDISHCNKDMIIGNSGSAVLNSEGELIGLFSFISYLDDNKPPFLNNKRNTGGGTNGFCIPFGNHQIPERCEFDEMEYQLLAIRYAYLSRQKQNEDQAYDLFLEIHKENNSLYSPVIKFTPIKTHNFPTEVFFNIEDPMSRLKSDFINQALPFIIPSFPECVKQGSASAFEVDLAIRVPDDFNEKYLSGNIDKSNEHLKIKSEAGEQTFFFERQKDETYQVTMIETDSRFLSHLLGLKTDHNFHFYIPLCE